MVYRENAGAPRRPYSSPRLRRFYLLGLYDRVRYRAWSWVNRILPSSLPSSRPCLSWCGCGERGCARDLPVDHALLADTHIDGMVEPHINARNWARELEKPKDKRAVELETFLDGWRAALGHGSPSRTAHPVRVPDDRTVRFKV